MIYKEWPVRLQKDRYQNGRPAILLIHAEEGDLVSVATVNLPEVILDTNEVCIKDYSENEGMLEFLINNKVVKDTGRRIPIGYAEAAVCKLVRDI